MSNPPRRQFGFWSAASLGILTGSSWPLFAGSLAISLPNGGAPGVLYETWVISPFAYLTQTDQWHIGRIVIAALFLVVSCSIAELASAIPSSTGVYRWATITAGPRGGLMIGYLAGWWNCLAYIFATVASSTIAATQLVQVYAWLHNEYAFQRWHVVLAYMACSWASCALVIFGNRLLPLINKIGLFWIVAGGLVVTITCAVMPSSNGKGYASHASVWSNFVQTTGYDSDGLVFLLGTLNGAYAFGVPDCISHIAEEVVRPSFVLPAAIFMQLGIGFVSTFAYLVALFYGTPNRSSTLETASLVPVISLYQDVTGSRAGACGLLVVTWLPCLWAVIGTYVTAGRMLWSLSRDNATPFSPWLARISTTRSGSPANATLAVCVINTALGLIYLGSTTALNAFAGSQLGLLLLSYLAAILPHLLNRRAMVEAGEFWMPEPLASLVHASSCLFIVTFTIIYCIPPSKPVTPESMNWTSVMLVGCTALAIAWWYLGGRSRFGANAEPVTGVVVTTADEGVEVGRKGKPESSHA